MAVRKKLAGYVHSIESFGSADGPGIRFIIFLAGCTMRCQYCHNPDTWNIQVGEKYTSDELLAQAVKYRPYWGTEGGITASGGEPLLQIEFVTKLFEKAKRLGIHTTLDTAGALFNYGELFYGRFLKLMKYTDLVLLDLKHIDSEQHKLLTGVPNENILEMATCLSDLNKPVWIRHVLVPGWNDTDADLIHLHEFIQTLNNVERVEVLPYHALGAYKWRDLGLEYPLEGLEAPTAERVENAKRLLGAKD